VKIDRKPKKLKKKCTKTYTNCFEAMGTRKSDALPSSFIDSNVSPR
jgi:hypothetical protein